MRSRRDAKCAKSVVAKVILPGCVHPRMIAVMWMKSAMLTATCLVWTGVRA